MKLLLPLLLGGLASAVVADPLTKAQGDELIKLYEEEIMAHDLYVELGKVHPSIRPFQNIPHSEASHRDAIGALLDQYKIAKPKPPQGRRFASDGLDGLFDDYLAKGRKSVRDACQVGVAFEELDIADLREAQKSIPAIKDTLVKLEWASGNHLRAFHRNLTAQGGKYKPSKLKKKDFKAILAGKGPEGATGCGDCKDCATGKETANAPKEPGAAAKKCEGDCEKCNGACGVDAAKEPAVGQGHGKGRGPRAGQGPPPGRGPRAQRVLDASNGEE